MSEELKPCPFCGGEHRVVKYQRITGYNDKTGEPLLDDPIDVVDMRSCVDSHIRVDKYNTRPIEDDLRARLEAAEAALRKLYEACYAADCDGELDERINGEILDEAADVLRLDHPVRH